MPGAGSPVTPNCTGTPRTDRPRASLATAVKRTTSPVRPVVSLAWSSSAPTGLASTSTASVAVTSSTVTVTSVRPGSVRVTNPNGSTSATSGAELT